VRARELIDSLLPYGYWIDRHGKKWPVKEWGDHSPVAEHLLALNGYEDTRDASYVAQTQLGLVRVAIGSGDVHADTIPEVRWHSLPRIQRQALQDIATERGKSLHFNGVEVSDA
jgi:hypothetical protein